MVNGIRVNFNKYYHLIKVQEGLLLVFLFCVCTSEQLFAQKSGRGGLRESPTVFLNLGGGITTYKSLAVKSNDTSFTVGYKIGAYAGRDKNIGFFINNESNTTNFVYAENETKSKIETAFQDAAILYRWGVLELGPVFAQQSTAMTRQDELYLDHIGSGIGVHLGILVNVSKDTSFFMEYTQATISELKETIQDINTTPVTGGARSDIFLGGIIQITRSLLDMRIGYKQRTFVVTVAGESFEEVQTFTWIGIGVKGFF